MADNDLEPDAERIRLESLLASECKKRDQLGEALSEFRHTGRRISDRLERVGGRGAELQQQQALLAENLKLTQSELEKAETQIRKIRRELSELAADQKF